MDHYAIVKKQISPIDELEEEEINIKENYELGEINSLHKDSEFSKINQLYDECVTYLKEENINEDFEMNGSTDPDYESIKDKSEFEAKDKIKDEFKEKDESKIEIDTSKRDEVKYDFEPNNESDHETEPEDEVIKEIPKPKMVYNIENELKSNESLNSTVSENRSERLRKFSQQLPKIIITQSNTSLNVRRHDDVVVRHHWNLKFNDIKTNEHHYDSEKTESTKTRHGKNYSAFYINRDHRKPLSRSRPGSSDFPKRLVSKRGVENIALISNIPFEKIRLLNDTFHTLINLRWRWIVSGTIVVHFAIWLIFAIFWYITALAHYDFEPEPPKRTCITGGHDFLTIFLASVEAQTTIGFGDRAIDEECPETIFLFIMQLILGTGLSGVLTCVVYAKLTRPEKLSRDGVGFSKKAVVSMRDGKLCLMMRAWDLNYDHIISSEFTAHFVHTHRTKEGEMIRYYAQTLALQQRQFLLWPVTLVHVIDESSPIYKFGPEHISSSNYEITVSLKGASASMGTFTQSQTSYLPKEVLWGHRFPPVVKYDCRKQKYVIEHQKLDATESVDTPFCSAQELYHTPQDNPEPSLRPATPSNFSEKISSFQLGRSSSFRKKATKG